MGIKPDSLTDFYFSREGDVFAYFVQREIKKIWNFSDSEKIVGLGQSFAYEKLFAKCAFFANFSDLLKPNSVKVDFEKLPLRDSEMNRVFAIHYLENFDDGLSQLQEAWRVLEPDGSLLLLVPNKNSIFPNQKIAGKKKLSHSSICLLLSIAKFSLMSHRTAVFHPLGLTSQIAKPLDKIGEVLLPKFGAISIYHARKLIFANRGRTQKVTPSLLEKLFPKKKLAGAAQMQQNKKL